MNLLGVEEASKLLNVKTSWLRAAIFKKILPHYKLQRLIKFDKDELEKWVSSQKQELQSK